MTKRSHGMHIAKSDIGWTVHDNSICGRGRLSGAFATKREAVMHKRRLAQALQFQRGV